MCPTLPPPPTFTLFPYTTLFRSRVLWQAERQPTRRIHGRFNRRRRRHRTDGHRHRAGDRAGGVADDQDRKSTRLNSSHLVISYAVFCLKKKNNRPGEIYEPTAHI